MKKKPLGRNELETTKHKANYLYSFKAPNRTACNNAIGLTLINCFYVRTSALYFLGLVRLGEWVVWEFLIAIFTTMFLQAKLARVVH